MSESESAQQLQGQPVFILSEDSERTSGRDAQQANIQAGKAIAEAVRTTLGPQGMDKMLVSDSGDVVVTNDGATILDEMDIEHPAAEMLVDVAEEQEESLGDGTTTAAILTGELLSVAEEFFDRDLHPRTVVDGYRETERVATDAIDDFVLEGAVDDDVLGQVATSAMTGKTTGTLSVAELAATVVDAVRRVETDAGVDRAAVNVEARVGRSASATEVIEGVLVDADPVHGETPASLADGTVAVLDTGLDRRETETDVEYAIDSTDQLSAAIEAEESELREYAETLAAAGVDVAFVTDDVADQVATHLAREGIVAFEDVDDDDAEAVVAATGATRVPRVDDVDDDDLGTATSVSVGDDDDPIRVEGGADTGAVTLLVRGGTDHALDEIERTVTDGVDAAVAAVDADGVVPGGGAVELALAGRLREAAVDIDDRSQLVVEAAADALDAIPRTLATNAGRDPIDTLVELRASNEDDEGRAGLVVDDGDATVADPVDHGVLDPASVKRASVRSAVEVATMIVRIDDVITAE